MNASTVYLMALEKRKVDMAFWSQRGPGEGVFNSESFSAFPGTNVLRPFYAVVLPLLDPCGPYFLSIASISVEDKYEHHRFA